MIANTETRVGSNHDKEGWQTVPTHRRETRGTADVYAFAEDWTFGGGGGVTDRRDPLEVRLWTAVRQHTRRQQECSLLQKGIRAGLGTSISSRNSESKWRRTSASVASARHKEQHLQQQDDNKQRRYYNVIVADQNQESLHSRQNLMAEPHIVARVFKLSGNYYYHL